MKDERSRFQRLSLLWLPFPPRGGSRGGVPLDSRYLEDQLCFALDLGLLLAGLPENLGQLTQLTLHERPEAEILATLRVTRKVLRRLRRDLGRALTPLYHRSQEAS